MYSRVSQQKKNVNWYTFIIIFILKMVDKRNNTILLVFFYCYKLFDTQLYQMISNPKEKFDLLNLFNATLYSQIGMKINVINYFMFLRMFSI